MSLVNDALRKARLEAARQEVDRSGAILPTLGHVRKDDEQDFFTPRMLIPITLGALALMVFLFVAMSGGPELDVAEKSITPDSVTQESTDIDAVATELESSAAQSTTSEPATAQAPPEPAPAARKPLARAPRATESRRVEPTPTPSPETEGTQAANRSLREPQQPTLAPRTRRHTSAPQRSETQTVPEPQPGTGGVAASTSAGETVPTDAGSPVQPAAIDDAATGELESFVREADVPGIGSFRLDGIAWSSDRPFALVNGQVIGPGGFVDGATVTEVAPDRVVLERDSHQFEIKLR